jgi:RNA polymerase sigma factor (sigma-70 family)
MVSHQPAVMKSLQQLFHQGTLTCFDDRQLLEQFVTRRDEAAFAALVALHGPLVLGVCNRILRDQHDIEDAFQATFLVLVRRASSIRDPGRLGPWLHGVARRVALRARSEAARCHAHHCHSIRALEDVAVTTRHQTELDELRGIIDEEVARLPARYREAIVICDLEGRSYAVAASRLRCPLGTVQSRLARGRARLRSRLIRRGMASIALESFLIEGARATVPDVLAETTVRAAIAVAAGNAAAGGAVSATAAGLARSMTSGARTATMQRITLTFAAVSIAIAAGLATNNARSNATVAAPGTRVVQPRQAEEPEPDRTLYLDVSSAADGSPLAGATVWVRAVRGRIYTWEGTTDEQGHYALGLPGQLPFLDILVAHAGHVTHIVTGLSWRGQNFKPALGRAEAIGGIVRDEKGQPIKGARVFPTPPYEYYLVWPEVYASPNSSLAIATTDAQGRWRADALPKDSGPDATISVLVTHPDHIANRLRTTAATARAFSIEQVMKTGVSVSGTVLSPFGRPVPGASVVVTMPPLESMFFRLTTDKNGEFHSGNCFDPSRTNPVMTVVASGLAMAVREISLRSAAPAHVIRLTRRRSIEGRVVDARGHPVAGAAVSHSAGAFKGILEWDADSDSDGRFVWRDPPTTEPIFLDVSKPNYRPVWERAVVPEADELTIVLHHPQRLHGTVTDAQTGRPVEQFTLILGSGPSLADMRPVWNRNDNGKFKFSSGKFDLSFPPASDDDSRQSILIEAAGYKSGELLGFAGNAEEVVHDFKLRKATTITGVVRGPDGRPLAGADVGLRDVGSSVQLYYYWLKNSWNEPPSLHTKTDGNGRYSLASFDRKSWIVAVHKAGVAVRSPEQLAASTEITLLPWGRIEGVVKIGNRIAPSHRVWAGNFGPGFDGVVEHTTRTDQEGRFKIDDVAPGALTVGRQVPDPRGAIEAISNLVDVVVAPGQTVRVEIGGTGRPVIGRFAVPGRAGTTDLVGARVRLRTRPPVLRMPAGFINFTDEQWSAWWDRFHSSPEGRAYLEGERQFAVAVHPDGTFRIEDVLAGRYFLEVASRGNIGGDSSRRLAFARADVVVPEIAGGRSDEPLDIGTVPVEAFPFRELNVGSRVPDITLKAADGRTLDLAAFRGKVVLLAFWSTRWSMAILPHLKSTYDAFGRDPRFVMIGLNEDFAPEAMNWCVARHDLAWEQRYLGSSDAPNPIAAAFGVQYLPSIFLIGPDGRVIAKDLEGDRIKQAVAASLSK